MDAKTSDGYGPLMQLLSSLAHADSSLLALFS